MKHNNNRMRNLPQAKVHVAELKAADGATNLKRTNITIGPASADILRQFGSRRAASYIILK